VWLVKRQKRKLDSISPPLFMSGGGFYFNLRIRATGCAWAAWRMEICLCRVGSLEMTARLMSLCGAAFMKEGGMQGRGLLEEAKGRMEGKPSRRRWRE
jgi:hypothetical protein